MDYDVASLPRQRFYQIATAAIQPRPIAWISTLSAAGVANLAPFSFFTVASLAPPVLSVTLTNRRDGGPKDTLRNLRDQGECVINIVTEGVVAAMNASCGDYPPEISEIAVLGLATLPSRRVAPPGIAAAPVRFECRLRQILPFGDGAGGTHVLFLDVLHIQADDDVLADGWVSPAAIASVGKLGGDGYAPTRERFDLPRPLIQP